ncbi:MAG TPA: 2-C-methyl-D-erythritol 4-phosphate cytidylyltransferase, partial [bacterium]|nr:2-C-methyl-D-erythritol 4-phosphate cytidylyltransferase [bacterium]
GQDRPKALISVGGYPLFFYSLKTFSSVPAIEEIVLVLPASCLREKEKWLVNWSGLKKVVAGGQERHESVWKGLQHLSRKCEIVLIHDVARPLTDRGLIERVIQRTQQRGACVPVVAVTDTVKRVDGGYVRVSIPRENLVAVQTPQGFRRDLLEKAFRLARRTGCYGSDDAFLVEQLGFPVSVVPGENQNIKVTRPWDLALLNIILKEKEI